jgi:uncharacterized membrane protein YkvA (DUF1232 family)
MRVTRGAGDNAPTPVVSLVPMPSARHVPDRFFSRRFFSRRFFSCPFFTTAGRAPFEMTSIRTLKEKARALKRESLALYFAVRDPRTPVVAKLLAGLVVAYALSPIDLIPDFIPVLGYLDELILLPAGIALCLRLIPDEILVAARARASAVQDKPVSYAAGAAIITIWLAASLLGGWWVYRLVTG